MKARLIVLLMCLIGLYATANAQNFWVIETNPKTNFTIVKIYNEQNQLVQEEKLEGKVLDVRSRNDRKLLNRKLKEVNKQKANALAQRASKTRRG